MKLGVLITILFVVSVLIVSFFLFSNKEDEKPNWLDFTEEVVFETSEFFYFKDQKYILNDMATAFEGIIDRKESTRVILFLPRDLPVRDGMEIQKKFEVFGFKSVRVSVSEGNEQPL